MRPTTVLLLGLLLAAPACDLFGGDQGPVEPVLTAQVVLVGEVRVQENDEGKAEFLGRVRNIGTGTARNVKVSASIFNAAGSLIDVASTFAVPSTLQPQQLGDFKIVSSTDREEVADFRITIEWTE